jgi:hypothetical protein
VIAHINRGGHPILESPFSCRRYHWYIRFQILIHTRNNSPICDVYISVNLYR